MGLLNLAFNALTGAAIVGFALDVVAPTNEKAFEEASAITRQYPQSSTAHSMFAWYLAAHGRRGQAREQFDAAVRLGPDDPATTAIVRQAFTNRVGPIAAAADPAAGPTVASHSRRVALVIGNAHYLAGGMLGNPVADAQLVDDALTAIGFSVDIVVDATYRQMRERLARFSQVANGADVALVYFAGHAFETDVQALLPVDAVSGPLNRANVRAIRLDTVLASMAGSRVMRIAIVDGCRGDPFAGSALAGEDSGIGPIVDAPTGATLVAYSAKHGQLASDGEGSNSPFAVALARRLRTPGIDVRKILGLVHDDVYAATKHAQDPYTYGSLGGADFPLNPG